MGDIRVDGQQEGVFVRTVEKACFDRVAAAQQSGLQPMHPINDSHGMPVDKDGRKRSINIRQNFHMFRVQAAEAW
jgi:hypothetical protein